MPKIKVSKLFANSSAQIKLNKNEHLSKPEFSKILKLDGFLLPVLKNDSCITYEKSNLISLSKYLKQNNSEFSFYYTIAQILKVFRQVPCYKLKIERLDLDLEHIFVDVEKGVLKFIYVPVFGFSNGSDIHKILDDVVNAIENNNKLEYIRRFISHMNNKGNVSIDEVEAYLMSQDENISNYITSYLKAYGFEYSKKTSAESSSPHTASKKEKVEDDDFIQTGLLEDEMTDVLSFGTEIMGGFFDDEIGETIVLTDESVVVKAKKNFASLLRLATEEKILINKLVFRLGRDESLVDYFITNNDSISRSHADIIVRGDRVYLTDNKSTNFTYVNNIKLKPKEETELFSGDLIKFSDEEFEIEIL